MIDAVKPKQTTFSIEMMGWSLPDGPDEYLRLIRAVDRPAFAVHMDVCNGINSPRRFYRNADFIRECFAKLGKWIVSCHAKDLAFIPEMNVHFKEVVPGTGQIDYATYLRELSKLAVDAPLMLEHLQTAEEYDAGRDYIRVGRRPHRRRVRVARVRARRAPPCRAANPVAHVEALREAELLELTDPPLERDELGAGLRGEHARHRGRPIGNQPKVARGPRRAGGRVEAAEARQNRGNLFLGGMLHAQDGARIVAQQSQLDAEERSFASERRTKRVGRHAGPADIGAFYELHVWAWKLNPSSPFADWNPRVSCVEHTVDH